MSDPVTNAEVEDVLSSIRRLVSEDKRPVQAQKSEPKNDRLVLTPALRVGEAAENEAENEPEQDTSDDVAEETSVSLESLITDDTPLDVYGDAGQEAEAEEDGGEDHLFDDPAHDYSADPYNFEDDHDEDGEGAEIHLAPKDTDGLIADADAAIDDAPEGDVSQTVALSAVETDVEEGADKPEMEATETPAAPVASVDSKAATLSAKIAALESAIGQISDTWEPDDAGDSDYAGTELQTMAWEDELPEEIEDTSATPAQEMTAEDPASSDTSQGSDEPDASDASAPSETTQVEAEAEQAVVSETVVPETVEPEAEAVEPETKAVEAEPVMAAAPAVAPSLDNLGDEQLLDEDALRDLISDIVRSELQGALGERITRNVRKLVRREIHRALAAQELE